jgi:autotransporter-associated beta strand protein
MVRGGVFLCIAALASDARAVSITGSTFAAETGGPGPNPTSTSFNLGNPTFVSSSIRSDVQYAHAQAWASAAVTCTGVTKTTGGRAWSDAPGGFDSRSTLWNASASGTQIIANYQGPGTAPAFAPFHFAIPGGGIAPFFNAFPGNNVGDPAGYTTPASMAPPASGQGFVVNAGTSGGTLPSFFDIFIQVNATAQQGSGQVVSLFQGTMLFNPNTPNQVDATGGFAGSAPTITPGGPGQYFVGLPTIQGGTFDAVTGQPFSINFDVYMTMGDPSHQFNFGNSGTYPTPFDFSSATGGPIGAASGFATQMLVNDPNLFMVTAAPVIQTSTWNGNSPASNWTTGSNWQGGAQPAPTNVLTFDGNLNTVTNNDFPANTQFNGLNFTSGAGAFNLGGNSVLLAGDIDDASSNPQTINLPIALNGGTINVNIAPGGSLTLGALTFGVAPQSAATTVLSVNNSFAAGAIVVQTNSATANIVNVASGAALNLGTSVSTTGIVVVGTPPTTAAPTTTSLTITGGAFNVAGGDANFIVGVGSGTNTFGGSNALLDMSGLSNFTKSGTGLGNFYVGFGTRTIGTVHLANSSNNITAHDMAIGDSSQTPGFTNLGTDNNGAAAPSYLFLGAGTNVLNLGGTLTLGNTKASGNIQFETSTGSVAINGLDPVGNPSQVPNIVVSRESAGSGTGTSSILLAGHNATIQAGTVAIGVAAGSSGNSTGLITFDTGTFNVQTLTTALHSGGTGAAIGTFVLGGPTPDTVATGILNVGTALNLANRTANGASADSGALIINGGMANVNANIVDASNKGTRTTTLTLAGGTLDMMGHAIGSAAAPITNVNLIPGGTQAATLKNLGGTGISTSTNPGGGLFMNGAGRVSLDGTNTYNGPTTVASGTLSVIGAITQSPVNLTGGMLTGNGNGTTTGVMPQVAVNGGTIRAGTLPGDLGNLSMAGLTLNSGGLIADLGQGFASDQLNVLGSLTLGSTAANPFVVTATGTYAPGPYDIINYNGPLNGSGIFTVTGPLGFHYDLDFGTPGKVFLVVNYDSNVLSWTGNLDSTWTTQVQTSPKNFTRGFGTTSDYFDPSPVSFNDTASPGATNINIAAVVSPSIVSVASSTNNYTFSGFGAIAGTGQLVKDGTSTLTILTNNTYSGTTTISNGTIQVGNGGTTGSLGTGSIAVSGNLVYNRSDIVTVANTITGSGSLQQLGPGTLILTANNSYGATTIVAGTLQIGNGGTSGSLGTGPVYLNNGAKLVFAHSDNIAIANSINGAGSISSLTPATVTLTGANSYTNGTTITQGTLSTTLLARGGAPSGIGASSSAAANLILNGGTLQYTGPAATTDRSFTLGLLGGSIDASGAGNAALNMSNLAPIAFNTIPPPSMTTLTLTGTSTGANTLAAQITDPGQGGVTGLHKTGAGTWVLTAANTYTGGTIIDHGTLRISYSGKTVMAAAAVNVAVNNDATLELANNASALSDGVSAHSANVTNNSTAVAGILVSGSNQRVGNINGTGTTAIAGGASLEASHIVQSALVIGGAATSQGFAMIVDSDAGGSPFGVPLVASLQPNGAFGEASTDSSGLGSLGAALGSADTTPLTNSSANQGSAVPEASTVALAVVAVLLAAGHAAGRLSRRPS